jgi:GT2 family glycosyltransferase
MSPAIDPRCVVIIVLNWNRKDDTLACLDSLAVADLGGAAVVVVDNGSRDGSADAVRERFPTVGLVALPENRGYAGGNNAGIRAALEWGAEAVLLLNNDTRVAPDFLPPLLWAVQETPRAGAVCSSIHRMDRPELLDVAYAEVRFRERDAIKLRGYNALTGDGFGQRREIEVAVGCSLLLTADALRTVGFFNEEYFAYHEDVDWCLRARRAGFTLLHEPLSRVFHRGSGSTAAAVNTRPAGEAHDALPNAEPLPWNPIRAYLGARNLVRLLRTYATPVERFAFARACARELPLEYLAIVFDREGWLRLGRWGYADAARLIVQRRAVLGPIAAAHRSGRTAQFTAHLRGLRDGLLNRPLPLAALGLR